MTAADDRRLGAQAWRRLCWALAALGLWATTVPYVAVPLGLVVEVPAIVEVVDHVVPGVVLLAIAGLGLCKGRLPLEATLLWVLAALWMTLTHLPLLAHAARGFVDWPSALFHSVPGLVLLALAMVGAVMAWRADTRPR